jgi:hypothetical protein
MSLTTKLHRTTTIALAAAAALLTLAPAAFADHDHGHGRGNAWGHRRYRAYYAQPVYAVPPPAPCAPRYVVYRPQRVLVVRPAPYVRIGGHFGQVDISAIFGPRRSYATYDYGCNFCDAHFGSFEAYENHVEHCPYRPANVRIDVRAWGDGGAGDYRGYDRNDYRNDYRSDDRNDDRNDDRGYNRGDDQGDD